MSETITIEDQVYTLDGLIKAYRHQIDDLKELSTTRILEAFVQGLGNDVTTFRHKLKQKLATDHDFMSLLVAELIDSNVFMERLTNGMCDRVVSRIEVRLSERIAAKEAEFWMNRNERLKASIEEIIRQEERQAGRQLQDVKHALAELLSRPIAEAVATHLVQAEPDPEAEQQAKLTREAELRGMVAHFYQEMLQTPVEPLPSASPVEWLELPDAPTEHTPV
jgi:type II secretory pathway component PulM